MDQVPGWLAAAITAAGVAIVYNAEDWDRMAGAQQAPAAQPDASSPQPPTLH
jgi:hypothetical protein